jgi:retinol dehydrogenase 12
MCFPPGLTGNGYEVQFGTNHVAHALLTKLLLPILEKAPAPRVVILTSDMWSQAPPEGIKLDSVKTTQEDLSTWSRYGQSKLANILWGVGLARRYPKLVVASVHPGVYKTGLQTAMSEQSAAIRVARKLLGGLVMGDPAKGTRNQLWAATSKEVKSGEYYTPVGVPGKARKYMDDRALVDRLWEWTEKELEGYVIDDLD